MNFNFQFNFGDWVLLKSLLKKNTKDVDACEDVLEVKSLEVYRSLVDKGRVTHWESKLKQGIIDSKVLFSLETCDNGFLPIIGDQVLFEAVESDQGELVWRAISVSPELDNYKNRSNKNVNDDESNTSDIPNDSEVDNGFRASNMIDIDLLKNKNGISITDKCVFNEIEMFSENEIIIEVKNESHRRHQIIGAYFKSSRTVNQTQLQLLSPYVKDFHQKGCYIEKNESLKFVFKVKPRFVGRSCELFIWRFKGFEIGRNIIITVVDSNVLKLTSALSTISSRTSDRSRKFINAERIISTKNGKIVKSQKSFRPAAFVPVKLGHFPVPNKLLEAILGNEYENRNINLSMSKLKEIYPCLNEPLCNDNYTERFHTLLYLEEVTALVNIREFDIKRAHFRKQYDYLILEVPGLAENRPSLLCGDTVIASNPCAIQGSYDDVKFEGTIHKICKNEIWLKFAKEFHGSYDGAQYMIVFNLNRSSFRRSHQAVKVAYNHLTSDWFFPKSLNECTPQLIIEDEENDEDNAVKMLKNEFNNSEEDGNSSIKSECSFDNNTNLSLDEKANDCNISIVKQMKNPNCDNKKNRLSVAERLKIALEGNQESNESSINDKSTSTENNCDLSIGCNDMSSVSNNDSFLKHLILSTSSTVSPNNSNSLFNNCIKNSDNDTVNQISMKTVEEIENSLLNNSEGFNLTKQNINKISKEKFKTVEEIENTIFTNSDGNRKNSTNKETEQRTVANPIVNIKWKTGGNIKKLDQKMESRLRKITIARNKKIKWFNSGLNHFQKEAIVNVLRGETRPLPYIIFGPPGTGKTVTLVETALQIVQLIPESRLLIGTPSNSSANLIAERMLDSGLDFSGVLVRLCANHYLNDENTNISDRLRPYCTTADINDKVEDSTISPIRRGGSSSTRDILGRHRVTIGTCVSLGVLHNMGFPQGHFTHVLVDEAGQATEPEILIPLSYIDEKYGQTILAGDPMQLGPMVLSKLAQDLGLAESLLSRLLKHFPYLRDIQSFPETLGFDPRVITQLIYNYRTLPEILNLPSSMFYENSLVPKVNEIDSEEATTLIKLKDYLPIRYNSARNYKLPPALVFHGIRGCNYQEEDSPSWFNPQEIIQAIFYVNKFYSAGLTSDKIGIVTPYQKQVAKLRSTMNSLDIPLPKIGSVEEFQGQEKLVIILSTVRSSPRLVIHDAKYALGFVSSPQRLNVALTRARALLIILGNPHLLNCDPYWRTVLRYCLNNDAYCGCDLPSEYES